MILKKIVNDIKFNKNNHSYVLFSPLLLRLINLKILKIEELF